MTAMSAIQFPDFRGLSFPRNYAAACGQTLTCPKGNAASGHFTLAAKQRRSWPSLEAGKAIPSGRGTPPRKSIAKNLRIQGARGDYPRSGTRF
jgi:hypothetical protein